jgi:hypothetical protein
MIVPPTARATSMLARIARSRRALSDLGGRIGTAGGSSL